MNDFLYGSFAIERNRAARSRFEEGVGGVPAGALFRGIGLQPLDLRREHCNTLFDVADGHQRQILPDLVAYFLARFVVILGRHASLPSFARL
jgi:hypothetical protein